MARKNNTTTTPQTRKSERDALRDMSRDIEGATWESALMAELDRSESLADIAGSFGSQDSYDSEGW